jgi:hypothetical protein
VVTGCREHGGPDRACCPRLDPLGYLRTLEHIPLADQVQIVGPRPARIMAGSATLDDQHLVDMAAAVWHRRERAA